MFRFAVIAAVALATSCAILTSAAFGGERGLTYIVPSAAGSSDGPAERPLIPDLIFADGSGMPTHLRQYVGQVVIINFWATWCAPCIKEMMFLDRLQGDFRGQPLTVLAISEDQGGIPVVRSFLSRQKYNYLRAFADPASGMAQSLAIRGLPTTIILDRHNHQVLRAEGPYQWDSAYITARLRMLMSEP
jgi:thiol-disulfide isomerase/thioredoxin